MLSTTPSLVLASRSEIRSAVLNATGIPHRVCPADLDEAAIKAASDDPIVLAGTLAETKAVKVSTDNPQAWVVGSDSIVTVDGRRFDKPRDRDEAAEHLQFFSGRAMALSSAVALARGGEVDWCEADQARLQVRRLSEAFIRSYLDVEWPEVSYCVGVFRLEGRGVQLFDSIDGDHFTILGMPLLKLLAALRERGILSR